MASTRTSARQKAKELAETLRGEQPDYEYLKAVFRHLREELGVEVPRTSSKRLPDVPTEEELQRFYEAVWSSRRFQDMVMIKTFLYTGARVQELANIRLEDLDFARNQVRINGGKGDKDRVVPFPASFREVLAMHAEAMRDKSATYLFESSRKKKYSDRGIRKMITRYAEAAELSRPLSPHRLRHFLLTWLKKQGIDDALIQPYSGHASRKSLEVYSRLALTDAQEAYDGVIDKFPL